LGIGKDVPAKSLRDYGQNTLISLQLDIVDIKQPGYPPNKSISATMSEESEQTMTGSNPDVIVPSPEKDKTDEENNR